MAQQPIAFITVPAHHSSITYSSTCPFSQARRRRRVWWWRRGGPARSAGDHCDCQTHLCTRSGPLLALTVNTAVKYPSHTLIALQSVHQICPCHGRSAHTGRAVGVAGLGFNRERCGNHSLRARSKQLPPSPALGQSFSASFSVPILHATVAAPTPRHASDRRPLRTLLSFRAPVQVGRRISGSQAVCSTSEEPESQRFGEELGGPSGACNAQASPSKGSHVSESTQNTAVHTLRLPVASGISDFAQVRGVRNFLTSELPVTMSCRRPLLDLSANDLSSRRARGPEGQRRDEKRRSDARRRVVLRRRCHQ